MIDLYRDRCVEIGMPEAQFWEMTITEIIRWVNGVAKRKKEERKEAAYRIYKQAEVTCAMIGASLSGGEILQIEEAFPEEFGLNPEEKARQRELAFEAQLRAFSAAHNNKLKKEAEG